MQRNSILMRAIWKIKRCAERGFPALLPVVLGVEKWLLHFMTVLFHLSDARHTYRNIKWSGRDELDYWKLSSKLFFYYHKIEKGLCMPGSPRFFGEFALFSTIELVEIWRKSGLSLGDKTYIGAMESLRAYRFRLEKTPPPPEIAKKLLGRLEGVLDGYSANEQVSTPMANAEIDPEWGRSLEYLCRARRSVRSFDTARKVEVELIVNCLSVAQLSPSACNRQPCQVHIYTDRQKISSMLELQNGNSGFGDTIPMLLVVSSESGAFFDGSERNEPYIDGGLFTMSLLLALQAKGLASCCLNWCVSPDVDLECHRRGDIELTEKIITYIAVGFAAAGALVPRSARREIQNIVTIH